jgi:dienelactone hydrolase
MTGSPIRLPATSWHDRRALTLAPPFSDRDAGAPMVVEARLVDRAGRAWIRRRTASRRSPVRVRPFDILPFLEPEDGAAYDLAVASDPAVGSRPAIPDLDPVEVGFTLSGAAWSVSYVQSRWQVDPGVELEVVREPGGARGVFVPASKPGRGVGLVALAGSGGGLDLKAAAALAASGVDVLALGLFGHDDLPAHMTGLALEHVAEGIAWLRRRLGHGRVALRGISKGSEGAALAAIHFPDLVRALLLWAPSPMATSGRGGEPGPKPLYTLRGVALPWGTAAFPTDLRPEATSHAHPYPMAGYFETMWRDHANDHLSFALEQARCPILLVSGGADGIWPSSLGARLIRERLARHGYGPAVEHLDFPRAGHLFNVPLAVESRAIVYRHPVQGLWLTQGGSPRANAQAAIDAYDGLLAFLDAHLGRGGS